MDWKSLETITEKIAILNLRMIEIQVTAKFNQKRENFSSFSIALIGRKITN